MDEYNPDFQTFVSMVYQDYISPFKIGEIISVSDLNEKVGEMISVLECTEIESEFVIRRLESIGCIRGCEKGYKIV